MNKKTETNADTHYVIPREDLVAILVASAAMVGVSIEGGTDKITEYVEAGAKFAGFDDIQGVIDDALNSYYTVREFFDNEVWTNL